MNRHLTICYTSDLHGFFSATDYAKNARAASGLSCCASQFSRGADTLILDGGDTLQGSPFTYWCYSRSRERSLIPARAMNLAGYDFVTLGNHDFNYGPEEIERYLETLDARCLCANIGGIRGVEKTALVTTESGLRVGLTGVTSPFITQWEKPENLRGITVTDAFEAAREALAQLKAQGAELTVCIYHGGFENDVNTGAVLSRSGENQGWRICQELDFDILLTGHQHMALECCGIGSTITCQPPDKGRQFIRMEVDVSGDGEVSAVSRLIPAGEPTPELEEFLAPYEAETAAFLDTPLGTLDRALTPDEPLRMALYGSPIANFFNQVQLEASGADISATCLGNEVRGFEQEVTVRDIVATYIFPNTLKTLRADRQVLKAALERSAEYFALDAAGKPCISESFLMPLPQHYNFDYISGLEVTADIRRAPGDRIVSIRYRGEELEEGRSLSLCLNNYRAAGSGGYPFYAQCETLREQPEEISEMIIRYVDAHRSIKVDPARYLHVIY